ncbi:ferrous iron transport protein B [Prevotella sp. E2-28]|uniref:ferrous iron transport protein B n=1 Tax=Prevotella sp. E2-28 TaxID=2913620 RepID=UPI001EDBCE67|nr:ferrous iron transport protein B [Prevotella sp. E2-28]UKK54741.1 ferrous iron transport protein B [Prevotella sp. E2-28]
MKLSELNTGEQGVIVKVLGHGGFRKRIIEMGFIKGKTVEVLQNAPLQDPVKYRVMGYEVSLRHHEAAQVEVVPMSDATRTVPLTIMKGHEEDFIQHQALKERRIINVALVGNPNCGKTSLFNYASGAHAHVGNYSGVTVDATEAHAEMFGYEFLLTDLPGTYSLSCYSPEELYVRKHLSEQMPDVVINVIDASNLERNLYLTTQLVDMNVRMVCALNMYDEFERRGDRMDIDVLSQLFGMPMIPTSFKTGRGVKDLFRAVIQVYDGKQGTSRHLHINYGHEIEQGISHIQQYLKADEHIRQRFSTRYLALKLLEHDSEVLQYVGQHLAEEHRPEDRKQLLQARDVAAARVQEETGSDSETAIMDAKYGFINGALKEAGYLTGTKEDTYRTTHRIDHILSHRIWGFPVFFAILFVMFQTTFILGQYPMDWIDAGVEWLGEWIGASMNEGPLRSMLVDGVIGGVGSVIVFLPQILILYCFISIMEDSGYMARAAFIMDKLMHKMGLHGKSFIPLVMGFGCNVPAVMATRTIESRRSRLITMMILPLMSCSARLPIYIMIVGTFFAVEYRSWVMISLYAIGILLSVVVSKVFSTFIIKGEDTPFVMELPPYRFPTLKAVMRHTWEKGKEYLKKMGGIILVASIIVWAMGYFSFTGVADSMETSIIGRLGQVVSPLFAPQGFNWQLDVSLMAGVGAKEIVASSIGVLGGLETLTPLQGYCYLLFVLIYFPCIATIVAIKNETGSWRWAMVSALYTTGLAWVVSALVYQIGRLF